MSESLDDAAFWLPPQFLADDDDVVCTGRSAKKKEEEKKKNGGGGGVGLMGLGFGFGSFDGFGASDLSETESDEEDFAAGISLRMARSSLDDKAFRGNDNHPKTWNLSGSPQSTLCALGFEHGSSRGSPTAASSRVSSPPPQQAPSPAPGTLDLLNAAAGEVAKIRTTAVEADEELAKINTMHLLGHGGGGGGGGGVGGPHGHPNPDFHRQFLFDQQKEFQIQKHQKQLQYRKMQQQVRYQCAQNCRTTLGLPNSAWPSLQQAQSRTPQTGSGMRAIFLDNPSAGKRECSGTGVFLPRQPGFQPETRKKPACSTVFVPARVVQALNLNLDDMRNGQPQVQPRHNGRISSEPDVTLRLKSNDFNNNVVSHQKRNKNVRPQQPQLNHEIRLPQDWTY